MAENLNIEKLKLARAARIKVREHIQEALSAVEQLDKSIAKFSKKYHPELIEIKDCVTKIVESLDFENNINSQILNSIDFYLEYKFCPDEEMAELEKEVNNIKLY